MHTGYAAVDTFFTLIYNEVVWKWNILGDRRKVGYE